MNWLLKAVSNILQVKAEVSRLEELKVSKMKELVLKKKGELEDICRKTHLIPESDSSIDSAINAVESGNTYVLKILIIYFLSILHSNFLVTYFFGLLKGAVDASCVLEQIELQISKVKEEALNRKEMLEKVEKWMAACVEESWLEEYNRVGLLYYFSSITS